ncbi:MAG: DEAD/DEAH box helicase, partial [Mariprofundales bacterium]|nr:DEAD/DEAH box helicase [Mariprofundales bacterium]
RSSDLISSRFHIDPTICELLCQRAARMGRYSAITDALNMVSGLTNQLGTTKRRYTERLALYTGDPTPVRDALHSKKDHFATSSRLPPSYSRIASTPIDMEWLKSLHDDIQFQLLYHITHAIIHGKNSYTLLQTVCHTLENNPKILAQAAGASLLANIYLWQGDIPRAQQQLPESEHSSVLALRGRIAFLHNDDTAAIALYQAALNQISRESRVRTAVLIDEDQIFYLFACLSSGNTALFRQASADMLSVQKRAVADNHDAITALNTIIDVRMQRKQHSIAAIANYAQQDTFAMFVITIGLHWLNNITKKESYLLSNIVRLDCYAQYHGMSWVSWVLSLIPARKHYRVSRADRQFMHHFNIERLQLPSSIEQRMSEQGVRSCLEILANQPEWQQRLQELKTLQKSATDGAPNSGSQRLAWLCLIEDQQVIDIEPRIQSRNKNGNWGRGRRVALKRLYNREVRTSELPFMTSHDQQICDCIYEKEDHFYYGSTTYEIDEYRAIDRAAGHPLLFLNNMHTPLNIDRKEVTLQVTREGENICITIHPFPIERVHDRYYLQWGGESQITLYELTDEQIHIANILGRDGLQIPQSAESEALESIAAIAPLLTVHSSVDGAGQETAQEVTADARLHLHLQPAGDGLQINCFVRPFRDAPLLLRPGEGGQTVFIEHEGVTLQTRRDLAEEIRHSQRLFTSCSHLDSDEGWRWLVDDPQLALETLEQLQQLDSDTILLEWPEGRRITLAKKLEVDHLQISMHKRQDWFEIDGDIQVDESRVLSIKSLLALVQESQGRFVRLEDDQFISLSSALYRRLAALHSITDGGRFHGLAAEAVDEITTGMKLRKNRHWQDHLQRLSEAQEYTPQLPSTLQAELRDYQEEGFRWMARLTHWGAGACLADDMGLGKTVQTLALMLLHAPHGPILVVAPTSVCMNWESEANRFAPTLKIYNLAEVERRSTVDSAAPFDVVICSYSMLQYNSELLTGKQWQMVVLDEAQAIKNGQTKRSKTAMALQAEVRVLTTGTPIENHLGELWNLFQFINPGLLGSLDSFNRRFANPIEGAHDREVAQRLKQLIRPFILRRLKSDVLTELPPRTEITIHVDLSTEEMALYEATRQRAMERIAESSDDAAGAQHLKVLAEIMRLRRACCHPSLIMPNSTIAGSKLAAFAECIDELREGNHKALVFSQFVGHLSILRNYLDSKKIPYQYLDGSTPAAVRKQRVAAFQAGEGELFLISLKAGGSGLNLTAADFVLHMDPWWNPAVEDQASDRAHRIGQTRPVTIYRFIARHTIEDKIVQLHQQKRDLADSLLEGSDSSGRLSLKEIMQLVEKSGNA